MSQFKDEPLSELPPEEESEEDTPLVLFFFNVIPTPKAQYFISYVIT